MYKETIFEKSVMFYILLTEIKDPNEYAIGRQCRLRFKVFFILLKLSFHIPFLDNLTAHVRRHMGRMTRMRL